MPPTYTIQIRRGTAAQWATANTTLASGEFGYETDSKRLKVGDGSAAWADLAYISPGPNSVVASTNIASLTAGQQTSIVVGTLVTTSDGKRWIYSGTGSKTSEASYVELADVTPAWSIIANKPTTFPPDSHESSHRTGGSDTIANVVVSPSQITANQNNYNPGTGDIFRLNADAARNITGIVAGSSGQGILLINVGSHAITLKHADSNSTAVNRMLVPWAGDYVMAESGGAALLIYDDTTDRWRVV